MSKTLTLEVDKPLALCKANWTLEATRLPSPPSVVADGLSRVEPLPGKGTLSDLSRTVIFEEWGEPEIEFQQAGEEVHLYLSPRRSDGYRYEDIGLGTIEVPHIFPHRGQWIGCSIKSELPTEEPLSSPTYDTMPKSGGYCKGWEFNELGKAAFLRNSQSELYPCGPQEKSSPA